MTATTGAMIKNTNPEEQFIYVDMTQLYWDKHGGFWRPMGTTGDRLEYPLSGVHSWLVREYDLFSQVGHSASAVLLSFLWNSS